MALLEYPGYLAGRSGFLRQSGLEMLATNLSTRPHQWSEPLTWLPGPVCEWDLAGPVPLIFLPHSSRTRRASTVSSSS